MAFAEKYAANVAESTYYAANAANAAKYAAYAANAAKYAKSAAKYAAKYAEYADMRDALIMLLDELCPPAPDDSTYAAVARQYVALSTS